MYKPYHIFYLQPYINSLDLFKKKRRRGIEYIGLQSLQMNCLYALRMHCVLHKIYALLEKKNHSIPVDVVNMIMWHRHGKIPVYFWMQSSKPRFKECSKAWWVCVAFSFPRFDFVIWFLLFILSSSESFIQHLKYISPDIWSPDSHLTTPTQFSS